MSRPTLLSLVALAASTIVEAQSASTTALEPLSSKHFTWPDIPYQVAGVDAGPRGPQFGYNLCNSTTENQQSLCQTMFLNNIADFCMWSSSETNDTVGESEAREVAWCTQPGHGTRVIPPGAITGAQWLYAKDYIQVVGYIDQTKVGLNGQDFGGELDPHGDDEQGNPLGGIVFTNGFSQNTAAFDSQLSSGNIGGSTNYTQVIEWVNFIGSNMFCLKMCNPSNPDAPGLCAHVYDEIGCTYNAIANYPAINNTFTVCDSDDMADPGVFVDSTGHTTTWFQPFSGTFSVPYTTTIPSSSNCKTYESTQLFAAAVTDSAVASLAPSSSPTAAPSGNTSGAGSQATGSNSRSGSSGSPTQSGNGAASLAMSMSAAPFLIAGFMTTFVTAASVLIL